MIAWLAFVGAFLLLLAIAGAVADWLETPAQRDARERNR